MTLTNYLWLRPLRPVHFLTKEMNLQSLCNHCQPNERSSSCSFGLSSQKGFASIDPAQALAALENSVNSQHKLCSHAECNLGEYDYFRLTMNAATLPASVGRPAMLSLLKESTSSLQRKTGNRKCRNPRILRLQIMTIDKLFKD